MSKEKSIFFEKLDANCNDCKYFKDAQWSNELPDGYEWQFKNKLSLLPLKNTKCRVGQCDKLKCVVVGIPQYFMGMKCFKYRKP